MTIWGKAMQEGERGQGPAEGSSRRTRYSDLYDLASAGYCTLDGQGLILEANLALAAMLGLDCDQLIQQPFSRYVVPDDQAVCERQRDQLFKTGTAQACEVRLVGPAGAPLWAHLDVLAVQGDDGTRACRVLLRDATETRQRDQEREQYFKFFLLSSDPMCIADPFGCFRRVNPAFMRLTGYEERELVSRPFLDFVLPEDRQKTKDEMKLQVAVRPSMHFENRYVCSDGSIIVLSWTAYFDRSDGVTYASARDITKLRRAEEELAASNEFSASVIESMQDGFSVLDVRGKAVDANPALCQMTGYSRDELVGVAAPHPYWPPEEYERIQTALQATLRGDFADFELVFMRKNGERFPVLVSPFAVRNRRGETISYSATVKDITERKRAELAVRDSEQRFRAIFEQAAVGVAMIDSNTGRFLSVNQRTCDIARLTREQMLATTFMDLTHPDDLPADLASMEKLKAGELRTFTMEKRYLHPDGSVTWINLTVSPMWAPGETPTRHIAVVEDISAHKHVEHALRENEEKFRALFENSSDAIFLARDAKVIDCNRRTLEIFGCTSREQIIGCSPADLSAPVQANGRNSAEVAAEKIKAAMMGQPQRFEWIHQRRDGVPVITEVTLNSVTLGHEALLQVIVRDISARKRAEEALRESNELFALFMRHSPIYAFIKVVSPTVSRVLQASDNFRDMIGVAGPDMVGKTMADLFPPDLAAKFTADDWAVVSSGKVLKVDEELNGRSYTSIKFPIIQGGITLLAGYTIDITERKQAQLEREKIVRKMQETQRLESLGVLAGGIAHDFNNLLTGIMGNASLASLDLPKDSPIQTYLEPIAKAASRAADLCKQMLAYSGKGRFVVQSLDLGELVEDTTEMLRLSISKKANLRFQLETGLPPVEVDATQVQQVVMNLVINASEAIGDKGGTVTLSTGVARLDRDNVQNLLSGPELSEGLFVYLDVSDDGCGMSPETQARIFDPFFTTKFIGRGLGLAAVLGIVRGHKGALNVTSQPGQGTTFRILFPAASGDSGADAAVSAVPSSRREAWVGRGTVLVVDDEETVRTTLVSMLEFLGMEAVLAFDGQDAVDVFRSDPGRFALVMLDLTMPHMDGEQAFAELRKIRPDVRVVLMSGFNQADAFSHFPGPRPERFLQKPFRMESLRESLRGMMG